MNTLRDLRQGALLHVLVALLTARPRSMSKEALADETAFSHERIEDAIRLLAERFRVIVPVPNPGSKWPRWQLAADAHLQLPLILALTGGAVSPGILHSTGSSSSQLENLKQEVIHKPLLLPQVSAGIAHSTDEFSTAQADLSTNPPHAHVVALLITPLKDLGCPEDRATHAVTQALNRGETPKAVAEKILTGKAYAASPAGRSIRSPGHWLAACLLDGRAIPQTPAPVDLEDTRSLTGYDGYLPFADNAPDAAEDLPDAKETRPPPIATSTDA